MNTLLTIVAFSIVLGVIVLIHEFGHYIAARLMGVRVEAFSFGFGKRIFGKQIGDTDFRFSLIPLGGYVKMAGEEEFDPENAKPDEFHAKNRGQKIFILMMGPLMNLLLTFFIFTGMNIAGVEVQAYKEDAPQVGYVAPESSASAAGIQQGDRIMTIDGNVIDNWKELEIVVGSSPGQDLEVEYQRGDKRYSAMLKAVADSRYNIGDIGIFPGFNAQIESVEENSPAADAGFKPGDVILAIDGTPLTVTETMNTISAKAETSIRVAVNRAGAGEVLQVTPRKKYFLRYSGLESKEAVKKQLEALTAALPDVRFQAYRDGKNYRLQSPDLDTLAEAEEYARVDQALTVGNRGVIGVAMSSHVPTKFARYGLFAAMGKSTKDMVDLTVLVFDSIRKMIVGKLSPQNLSGPIEIAKYSQRAMKAGIGTFLMLIAFISLQLGLINLFPIPALDGGHLLIYSIESVIRRDFSMKIKNALMNVGFALLIALMVFVLLNDFAKTLPNGWSSLIPF